MRSHLEIASALANLLDNQFGIGKLRFGLSAIFDLIPGIGDLIDVILSLYIVCVGVEMGVSVWIIARMLWNILVNFIIGLIPVFGDVAYIFRKANLKNVKLLENAAKSKSRITSSI